MFGILQTIRYTQVQSEFKSKAFMIAAVAAGLLCLQTARADILQDFTDSVAARADSVANGKELRPIPDKAAEGVMFPPRGRLVAIDGTVMRLAPGSKIRDLENRIVSPSTITAPVNVRYTIDLYSQVHNVWLMPGDVELEQKEVGNPSEN